MAGSKSQGIPRLEQAIEPILSLTASRDVKVIKLVIRQKYGERCRVTDKFAEDLIAFVEALTDGQQG